MDAWEEEKTKEKKDAEINHAGMDRKPPESFGKVSDAGNLSTNPDDPDEEALLTAKEHREGEARPVVADSQTFRNKKSAMMAHAQHKCDVVASAFSRSAPRQLDGESIRNYRIRLLQPYKANSAEYAGVGDDILKALPPKVFDIAENKIYADSIAAARNPNVPAGELWPVYETDATGRRMTTWRGQPRVWLEQFSCRPRRVIGIRNHSRD